MNSPSGLLFQPPIGYPDPIEARTALALKALVESRWDDARRHIDSLDASDSTGHLWKLLLQGELLFRQGHSSSAEPGLIRAASIGLSAGLPSSVDGSPAVRLAATALERVGVIRRRGEKLDAAVRAHGMAFQIRRAHGSPDEQWESATSLALDHELAGRFDEALRWARTAAELAEQAAEAPLEKQAIALSAAGRALSAAGDYARAVESFRESLELWRRHAAGASQSAAAQMRLGQAMLRLGENLLDSSDPAAGEVLRRSRQVLLDARDALWAFGDRCWAEGNKCERLADFAARLLASCDGDEFP